jgi:hypothetical protein
VISVLIVGAGLAVLAALEMGNMYNSTDRTSLVTFGQPRMGNGAFAEFVSETFKDRIFRITNKADATPFLPVDGTFNSEWVRLKCYNLKTHHSREMWINERNETISCQKQDGDMACSHGQRDYSRFNSLWALKNLVFSSEFRRDTSFHNTVWCLWLTRQYYADSGVSFGPAVC